MHLVVNKSKHGKKIYQSILLRQSYRENGKVKKRTIANLSKCKEEEIEAIRLALKYKDNLACLINAKEDIEIEQGLSVGAVYVLYEIAKRLGIVSALGKSEEGKLALWQVISRTLRVGSRLSSTRLAREHAAIEILKIEKGFSENDLYANLKWLTRNQEKIEKKLLKKRRGEKELKLFLYDVTSSYLEGEHNFFGEYGYNRDKKKGKKQIVVGLLCDSEGYPVSVEVYKGNTNDLKTFLPQVKKLKERYGFKEVIFVGDRGIIKNPQIEKLPSEFRYITAISKEEIRRLMKEKVIAVGIFDDKLTEIEYEGVRYVVRRNPEREAELRYKREEKLKYLEDKVKKKNEYLLGHPRAKVEVALRYLRGIAKKLNIDKWVEILNKERECYIKIDEEKLKKIKELDGCYVLKSDLSREYSKEMIHEKYKSLGLVEQAFRDCKSTLELRPIYVRTEESTRAHVFVAMLSYILLKYLEEKWSEVDMTVSEGLESLSKICSQLIKVKGKKCCNKIPKQVGERKKLLSLLNIKLPDVLPVRKVEVVTMKKLKRKQN